MQPFGIWFAGSLWRKVLIIVIVALLGLAAVVRIVVKLELADNEQPVICVPEIADQPDPPKQPDHTEPEHPADEPEAGEEDSVTLFVGHPARDVFDAWGETYETGGYMGGFMVSFPQRKAAVILDKSGSDWDMPLTGEEIVLYELHWGTYQLEEAYTSLMTYAELERAAEASGSMIELFGRMEGYESDGIAQIASVDCGGLTYSYTWGTGKKLSDQCDKVVIGYPHITQLFGNCYQEAYQSALYSLREEYGTGEHDETGFLHGVVYAELITFEDISEPALLCVAIPDALTGMSNRLFLFVWTGEAARCVLNTTVGVHYGTTDTYAPITISNVDGTQWILIGNSEQSGMVDECTAYTINNGVLKLRLFYAENTEGETWPPIDENLDVFYIDGHSVSQETYCSQRDSLKYADGAIVTDVLWQADPASVEYVLEQLGE